MQNNEYARLDKTLFDEWQKYLDKNPVSDEK